MWESGKEQLAELPVFKAVIQLTAFAKRLLLVGVAIRDWPVLFGGNGVASSITRLSGGNKTKPWFLLSANDYNLFS